MWPFPPQVSINLGLVYKVQQHNGIIFQFLAFSKRRQRVVPEILAAGGRYDLLVRTSPVCADLLWLTASPLVPHLVFLYHYDAQRQPRNPM